MYYSNRRWRYMHGPLLLGSSGPVLSMMQRRSRFLVLALLLWAAPAWATMSGTLLLTGSCSGSSTCNTANITPTAGDTVAVCMYPQNGRQETITATGYSFTCTTNQTGNGGNVYACYAFNVPSGTIALTMGNLGFNNANYNIYDISGGNGTIDAAGTVAGAAGSAATSYTLATATLAQSTELILACSQNGQGAVTGSTLVSLDTNGVTNTMVSGWAAPVGTAAATAGFSRGASSDWVLQLLTFESAAVVTGGSALAGPAKLAGPSTLH